METKSNPTIKDVARECGLSLATVSKVINGLPVGKASRQKVEAAIEKLGYRVNPYARALKSNKTFSVALVMPSLKHPFFAYLSDELTKSLMSRGYQTSLIITNYDLDAEKKSFAMVRDHKMDGVIALTYNPDIEVDESVPVVTIDRHLGENIPCVSADNYHGGELAAEKLIELGCKKLLFLRVTSKIQGEPDKRCAGFESVCNTRGIEHESFSIFDSEDEEQIYDFIEQRIRDGKPEFDGIFCNSDMTAVRVIRFLSKKNIKVPEQVQIIGFDGIVNRFTGHYACSTIIQPIGDIAETAVKLLLNLDDAAEGVNIYLPVRYVSGGTTKE